MAARAVKLQRQRKSPWLLLKLTKRCFIFLDTYTFHAHKEVQFNDVACSSFVSFSTLFKNNSSSFEKPRNDSVDNPDIDQDWRSRDFASVSKEAI